MPNADQTQSFLYRDTDLWKFAVLRQRTAQWAFQKKYGYSDGRGHGPGNSDCYACSLAGNNPESGCSVHGIEPQAMPERIEKSFSIA